MFLVLQIFRRTAGIVSFEYYGEVAAGIKTKGHSYIGNGYPFKKHFFRQLDFLVVNIVPGRNTHLCLEFLLKLGSGQTAYPGKIIQGDFRVQIGLDKRQDLFYIGSSRRRDFIGEGHKFIEG